MDEAKTVAALAALGHEIRLKIFRLLVRAGPEGLNIGEIAGHLDLAPSTLAHHLASLKQAGLVSQEKRGREVRTVAEAPRLQAVMSFVMENCCVGVAAPEPLKG
ncbi:MAG: metalloregulator ArsR/SmtB family transcription factor [Pseudomonadota bacterium]